MPEPQAAPGVIAAAAAVTDATNGGPPAEAGPVPATDYFTDYVEVTDEPAPAERSVLTLVAQSKPARRPDSLLAPGNQQLLRTLADPHHGAGHPAQVETISHKEVKQAPPAEAAAPTRVPQSATVVHDVAVEVVRAARAGKREVSVRLDPPELGKVEIRWTTDEAGKVRTVVAADNPATLELLRRDSGQLARALNSAGVAADSGAFSFNLRQDNGSGGGQQRQAAFHQAIMPDDPAFGGQAAALPRFLPPRRASASGRLDLVI